MELIPEMYSASDREYDYRFHRTVRSGMWHIQRKKKEHTWMPPVIQVLTESKWVSILSSSKGAEDCFDTPAQAAFMAKFIR
jgi:hypothetical protein